MKLLDRLYTARDRLIADAGFQRWAASFPLTRPIARRYAQVLFDLCAGFVYSQVLFACVRLRLFEQLADGPLTRQELEARLGLRPEAVERLMAAAISLRLVDDRGPDRFGLGLCGAALLANPSIADMVEHHAMLYADLQDPVCLLRGERGPTRLAEYWPYASRAEPQLLPAERLRPYTELMAASQALIAADLLDAYPFGKHRCLLDVGGGNGTFLSFAAARFPKLDLVLFDLPAVAAEADTRLSALGLGPRVKTFGGDFLSDELPRGADVVSLVRIAHDHDDMAVIALLRSIRRSMSDDGMLLIAEPMSATPGAERVADAYFGFYLLAMGSGRPRSPQRLAALLRDAGFEKVRVVPTRRPFLARLLQASPKPGSGV